MGIDIRTPIGLLFSILGLLLVIYGLASGVQPLRGAEALNVYWGATMLAFGLSMLALAHRHRGRAASAAAQRRSP